ncbi:MAG: hypothetical protein K2K82_05800 [Muribaculaceae bacterium]|nr:hypothetical protein [Muribaculaceae bacterium]
MEEALHAYDLALTTDDLDLLSRIEFLIARIYVNGYDDAAAYKWDLLSLEHQKQYDGPKERLIDTYENLGFDLLRMMWVKSAIQYADTALSLSSAPRPHSEEIKCLSYLVLHDKEKSDSIIGILQSLNYESPYVTDMLRYFDEYTPEKNIEFLKSVIKEKNDYITNIKEKNLSEYRQDFEREKSDRLSTSLKAKQKENIIITVIGVLIVISLSLMIISLRFRAKAMSLQKENQIQALTIEYEKVLFEQTSSLERIKTLEHNIEHLSINSIEAVESDFDLRKEISSAFLKQFSWLDKLGTMYIKANKSPRERERILYETVDKEIHQMSSKNNFLNEVQGLMSAHAPRILEEIEGLNLIRSEKEIVIYSICGLSPALMAVLANKSLRAIYNLKARIREKLTRIDSPFASQLIEVL